MEAVGQLTGGIAHDFNNMLAVIMSSLRLAQQRLERGDVNIQGYITGALGGAARAANLVARLLAFSRQQPLSPQRTDANQLLSGMEEVPRRTKPESIVMEFVRAGGLWSIHADPNGLESAIVNLAVNARDAVPDGGKLTIETANAYLDDPYAAAHAEVAAGQYVLIAITDTGHGMTPEVRARAFEPFFMTKTGGAGTGLGVSQVYGFMKQSGGHVKIYSEPGIGTTVKLYIPRLPDKEAASPSQSIWVAPRDVVMPGMNGRKLAEEALRRRPNLKVLFTTGYTRNAIVHNGTYDGVELIVKPFTLEALAAKIAWVLGPSGPIEPPLVGRLMRGLRPGIKTHEMPRS